MLTGPSWRPWGRRRGRRELRTWGQRRAAGGAGGHTDMGARELGGGVVVARRPRAAWEAGGMGCPAAGATWTLPRGARRPASPRCGACACRRCFRRRARAEARARARSLVQPQAQRAPAVRARRAQEPSGEPADAQPQTHEREVDVAAGQPCGTGGGVEAGAAGRPDEGGACSPAQRCRAWGLRCDGGDNPDKGLTRGPRRWRCARRGSAGPRRGRRRRHRRPDRRGSRCKEESRARWGPSAQGPGCGPGGRRGRATRRRAAGATLRGYGAGGV